MFYCFEDGMATCVQIRHIYADSDSIIQTHGVLDKNSQKPVVDTFKTKIPLNIIKPKKNNQRISSRNIINPLSKASLVVFRLKK